MAAGLLEETKSVLKSLIISSPHGMTVDRLNKDYREWEGRSIPFSDLGYNKLETFLRSLDDTLVVTGSGFNATVTAVASEKSAHIDKMVTKQKSSTRKRSRLKPHQEILKRFPASQPHSETAQHSNSSWQASKPNSPGQLPHQSAQSILQQQTILQNVLLRQQQQVQQTLQQNLMQNMYRFPTSTYNSSYNNLLHHPLLPQTQKQLENWQNYQYSLQTRPQYFAYQQNRNIPLLSRLDNMDVNALNHSNQKPPVELNLSGIQKLESEKTDFRPESSQSNGMNDSGKGMSPASNDLKIPTNKFEESSPKNKTDETERKIVNGDCNGDTTFSSSSTSTRNTSDCDRLSLDATQSNKVCTPIENKNDNNDDALGDVSHDQLAELEEKLGEITISSKSVSRKRKLYSNKFAEAVPELQKNDIVFQLDFPIDTVRYGDTIPEAELPDNLVESSWFGVFIAEVHNPYKFWFHLYKENHELDTMMQHIENIYVKLPPSELQMHRSCFKPGQICCALFMGLWHRAEILEVPENDTVKVLFIDYGTVSPVELHEVKFLLTEFSTLPCQALRGSLAHIRPVDHRWSRDATYSFLGMVQNLFLYAKATEVDYKEKVVKMILIDTNNKSDFQINEALVRKGHARISTSPQTNSSDSQNISIERRKHFQELYPTFDMLEKGEYPSFYEISLLLSKGIDFEALQDENIIPDLDGGHSIEEITRKLTSKTLRLNKLTVNESNRARLNFKNNVNFKLPPRLKLGNSAGNENSSVSSISDNLNPFLNEENNIENHVSGASAFDVIAKIDPANPFLSDSDFEQDVFTKPKLKQFPPPYFNTDTITHMQNSQEISSQKQSLHYGYMPPPMPMTQNAAYFPSLNNMPFNSMITREISKTTVIRPPPGFEHLAPKARNVFL